MVPAVQVRAIAGPALLHLGVRLAVVLVALAALSGCATWDVHEVRDPRSPRSMIGMTWPDLVQCMGTDYAWVPTKPDEAAVTWSRHDSSTSFKGSVTLFGSVEIGGGGGCSVTADVLRDGTVADLHFPQSFNDGLLAEPYHACKPLIDECIGHKGSTGLPRGYDAFPFMQRQAPRDTTGAPDDRPGAAPPAPGRPGA